MVIGLALPLADVLVTSSMMNRLCPNAGVFTKRAVKVDGYLTDWGSADLLERGFKYIESWEGSRALVVYKKEGGVVNAYQHLPGRYEPVSRYEMAKVSGEVVSAAANIDLDRAVVRDRETGDELGYSLRYHAYPGWFDRQTIGRFGQLQWRCPVGKDAQELDLAQAVLLPK